MSEENKQGQKFDTRIWMKTDDDGIEQLDEIQSFAPLPNNLLNFDVPGECDEQSIVGSILAQQCPHLFV